MKSIILVLLAFGLSANSTFLLADDQCKTVKGRVVSQVVTEFSDGSGCDSPIGICSEGKFSGKLKGKFTFTAVGASPYVPMIDPDSPGDIFATTGILNLKPKRCHGRH